jgi:hypothetical protein
MNKNLNWSGDDATRPLGAVMLTVMLNFLAAVLQAASDMLTRLALRLSAAEAITAMAHTVEFHTVYRDSGAPEGALYVNGELVGKIAGVTRL